MKQLKGLVLIFIGRVKYPIRSFYIQTGLILLVKSGLIVLIVWLGQQCSCLTIVWLTDIGLSKGVFSRAADLHPPSQY